MIQRNEVGVVKEMKLGLKLVLAPVHRSAGVGCGGRFLSVGVREGKEEQRSGAWSLQLRTLDAAAGLDASERLFSGRWSLPS